MKDRYALLSFLIPATVRTIPEILSWPYPIGFDTLVYAAAAKQRTYLNLTIPQLLKQTSLLYILDTYLSILIGDPILAVKILGPLLTGLVSLSIYIYTARKLRWHPRKALLASILAGTYFVALRISWEMYRQMLATFIFFLATAHHWKTTRQLTATMLAGLLIAWTHEFITVLFAAAVLAQALVSRNPRQALKTILVAIPAGLLFLYQTYSPAQKTLQIPAETVTSATPIQTLLYTTGFLLYLYLPLAPLIIPGLQALKDTTLLSWTLACLALTYSPLTGFTVLWFRWTILLAYPLAIAAAQGYEELTRRTLGKLALSVLLLNLAMSLTYLVLLPEQQYNKYFGDWNPYKHYIQTSMLQNSLPLSDTLDAIQALKWLDNYAPNSTLVLHEAFHNWAVLTTKNARLVRIGENKLSSPIRENTSTRLLNLAQRYTADGSEVYTVWWTPGKGWYNMPTLPPQFKEVKSYGNIAVYKYQP